MCFIALMCSVFLYGILSCVFHYGVLLHYIVGRRGALLSFVSSLLRAPVQFIGQGRVNSCVVFVTIITIISVLPIRGGVGGIVRVVSGSVLILKEWAPVSVSNIEAPGFAMCKAMNDIDYVIWKGERSEALSVQSLPGGESHEEIHPLGIPSCY